MTQRAKYNCYIDESGDEGIQTGGSRWFVLASAIVPAVQDLGTSRAIDSIKQRLRKQTQKPLHWTELNHNQKKVVIQELINQPFTISAVAVDKNALTKGSFLSQPSRLYFYAVRYLVERISWFVNSQNGLASLTFENKSSLDYDEITRYLTHVRNTDPECQIRWQSIDLDNIRAEHKAAKKMLQVADACAGTIFKALEHDTYGNIEESYLLSLQAKIYRHNGKAITYGLKFMPRQPAGQLEAQYPWLKQL